MTLAISTSGPYAIVAQFDTQADLVSHAKVESQRAASGGILRLMDDLQIGKPERIIVDIGPGSFTGVRVGVTMAKMWAQAWGVPVFGVSAFDLISDDPVAIPSKKGEVYVRQSGSEATTMKIEDAKLIPEIIFAGDSELADLFKYLPNELIETASVEIVPLYVANPSISKAKQSHIMGETFGGRQNV